MLWSRRHDAFMADLDPSGDLVMVGAGQHEQPGGDKVVAGVDTRRPRSRHHASCLGEQVTTPARQRPKLLHRLVDRPSSPCQPSWQSCKRKPRRRSPDDGRRTSAHVKSASAMPGAP
jgi:hypothetical protein